jgi:hypothetical protein
VRKEIRERGSEISHLYTSPTSTYKFISEIEDKFRVIEPEIVKLSGGLRTGSMKFTVLDSTSVCRVRSNLTKKEDMVFTFQSESESAYFIFIFLFVGLSLTNLIYVSFILFILEG